MCGNMVDIQPPTAEIRRGKKERQKKKKETPVYQTLGTWTDYL